MDAVRSMRRSPVRHWPGLERLQQDHESAGWFLFKSRDANGVQSQHRLDLLRGTIATSNPDHSRTRSFKLAALLKIGVLGRDRKAPISCKAPHCLIVRPVQPRLPHMDGIRKDVGQQADQARRQVLVEQQLHAARVNCMRSRSAA